MQAPPSTFQWVEGDDILDWVSAAGSDNELAGALSEFSQHAVEVVPSLAVEAPVAGPVPSSVFRTYLQALDHHLHRLRAPVDGVVFGLHGSTTAADYQDAQLTVVEHLRKHLGPDIPIVVSFDLHASPSIELQRAVDGMVAYHTAPHRDVVDTGRRAARLLLRILAEENRPHIVSIRVPILLPGEFGQTDREPIHSIMDQVSRLSDAHETVLEASLLQGYPWADSPDATVNLIAVVRQVTPTVLDSLETVARSLFSVRRRIYQSVPAIGVDQALDAAKHRDPSTLLYLMDSGDNPTAGAVEDRADFLAAALEKEVTGLVFAPIVAPLTVAQVKNHVGSTLSITLGDQLVDAGTRANVEATVVKRFDDDDLGGDVVLLDVRGNLVIATTRRVPMHAPDWIERFGINPKDASKVFVIKSGYLFPAYQDMLAAIPHARDVLVATPGASSLAVATFSYRRVPRPVYPLEDLDESGQWRMTRIITGHGHIQAVDPCLL